MAPTVLLSEAFSNDDVAITTATAPDLQGIPYPVKKKKTSLLHRSLTEQPQEIVSASGSYLHLSSGISILDGCGGAAVAIILHGNEEVHAATMA